MHTYQVHEPYSPPRQYRQLFADIPGREPVAMVANAVNYDRETRFTDDQLAWLRADLAASDSLAAGEVEIRGSGRVQACNDRLCLRPGDAPFAV